MVMTVESLLKKRIGVLELSKFSYSVPGLLKFLRMKRASGRNTSAATASFETGSSVDASRSAFCALSAFFSSAL